MIVNKSVIIKYGNICVHVYWNDSVSGWRLSGCSTDKIKWQTEDLGKNKSIWLYSNNNITQWDVLSKDYILLLILCLYIVTHSVRCHDVFNLLLKLKTPLHKNIWSAYLLLDRLHHNSPSIPTYPRCQLCLTETSFTYCCYP